MAEQSLILATDGDLAEITLNRPEVHNALSIELSDRLVEAIQTIKKSTDIKFVVIKGAGKSFCAGDDIKEMAKWGDDEHGSSTQGANGVLRRIRVYQDMANSLEDLDKMTISAVDGLAVGGGLEITMACDFVIATERSVWGMPEVDSGLTPGWGGTTRLSRLIGKRRTKEINILGALMSAEKAVDWGLWNRVVPDNQLSQEVDALLTVLRSKNQQACRQLKYIINRGCETDLYTAQGFEMLSGGLSGAVNGFWQVRDADQGSGVLDFSQKGELWKTRRSLSKYFWSDIEQAKQNPVKVSIPQKNHSSGSATTMNEVMDSSIAVAAIFEQMPQHFLADAAEGINETFQYRISGDHGGDWYCVIKDRVCTVFTGIHDAPVSTINMESRDFVDMMTGKLSSAQAFTSGKLRIDGDIMKAQLLEQLFKR